MTPTKFDVIVLGVGGMGAAALLHLARRKVRVCGIEQFSPGHDRGASHGDSRMIREAYFEHPDYVPLVRRSYALWRELEAEAGQRLLETPGVLMIGPQHGTVISGMKKSASLHKIKLEDLTVADCKKRFPGHSVPSGMMAVFEPGAGFLHVESAVRAHVDMARRHGAVIFEEEKIAAWQRTKEAIVITTTRRRIETQRIIITAGPWSSTLLKELGLPLRVYKMMMLWFEEHPGPWTQGPQPGFGYDVPGGFYYGLPRASQFGVKVGKHVPEEEILDPSTISRDISERHFLPVRKFVETYVPMLSTRLTRYSTCMYTMTPDEHFIIDRHPDDDRVSFAAGFSGHGFKFAPVVGEILADLCLNGATDQPCEFLKASRFR